MKNFFRKIKMKFDKTFKRGIWNFKNSNYYKHAIKELRLLGYKPIKEEEDGPNKWIQENLLELLEVFDKQGHSGFSANYCINAFSKLADFKTLSPITCSDDEFGEPFSNDETKQNMRLSSVFKKGNNGRPYYIDAIVWKEENGDCFTGTVEDISSSQYIKNLPFEPKTFYIDVKSWEVNKDTGENEPGSGWWESEIKDKKQLDEVFEYYDKYEKL